MATKIPTIRISIYDGDTLRREEVFNQRQIRIGKAGQAHIKLDDKNVSRQHAIIEVLDSGDVKITDLESTNGTKLNGERIREALLRSGDEITVGQTKLVITIEGLAEPQKTSERYFAQPVIKDTGVLSEKTALEIMVLWNEELVQVQHLLQGTKVIAGEKPDCHIFLPSENLGSERVELVIPEGNNFLLDVKTGNPEGDCLIEGRVVNISELEKRGELVRGRFVRINEKTRARLRYGQFILLVSESRLPEPIKIPFSKRVAITDHIYTILSLILHLLFLIGISLVPEEQIRATKDPYERKAQAIKMVQVAEMEKLAKLERQRKAQADAASKAKKEKPKIVDDKAVATGDSKKFGEGSKVVGSGTGTGTGVGTGSGGGGGGGGGGGLTSKLATGGGGGREVDRKVADMALTRVLAQQEDLLGQVLEAGGTPGVGGAGFGGGRGGIGGIKVIGSVGGAGVGAGWSTLDAFGGSLGGGGSGGFRGTPLWGGGGGGRGGKGGGGWGQGFATEFEAEEGGGGTKGIAGLAKADAVKDAKTTFKKADAQPIVYTSSATVTGELDREIVERYVRTKMDQIRFCFQQEVQKDPNIGGQIVFSWVISPTGKVIGVTITSSTVKSEALGQCIAARIATWVFPSPKGGGTVRVNYPFIFKVTKG